MDADLYKNATRFDQVVWDMLVDLRRLIVDQNRRLDALEAIFEEAGEAEMHYMDTGGQK